MQTIEQFGQTIKSKYPQYNDIQDAELGQKMLDKYPQYKDMVSTGTTVPTTQPQGFWQKAGSILSASTMPGLKPDIGIGALKGLGSTITSLGQTALKGISKLPLPQSIKSALSGGIQTGEELKQTILKPTTTEQKIGKTAEQIGEFMIPIGAEEKAVSLIPKAGKVVKFAAKTAADAIEFGTKEYAQTGDLKKAAAAALFGALSPLTDIVTTGVKNVVKDFLPERLYSQIFKRTEDDVRAFYYSVAGGKEINPTLAKELIDRNVMGSSQNMAVFSINKINQLEKTVQDTVKATGLEGKTIQISNNKAYINLLEDINKTFKKGFYSGRATTAQTLANKIKNTGGNLGVGDTLTLRRFLDDMRNTSSFRMNANLSPRQEEFKDAANFLRTKLSAAGLKNLMNEERIYIEALDNIVTDAVRRENTRILNLTDAFIGGTSLAAKSPGFGLGTEALFRSLQQPLTLTGLGQGFYKTGKALEKLPPASTLMKAVPPTITQSTQ